MTVLADATATLERLDVARAHQRGPKMRSQTDDLREALIGSVSHELRTPLASILGAATVLIECAGARQPTNETACAGAAWCATRPNASTTTSRTCSMPPASSQQVRPISAVDRAGRHRQFGDRALQAKASKTARFRSSLPFRPSARARRSGAGAAGAGADSRQCREILSARLAHLGRRASARRPACVV
jgi:hypothetical protein